MDWDPPRSTATSNTNNASAYYDDYDGVERQQQEQQQTQQTLLSRRRRKQLMYKYLTWAGASIVYWSVLLLVASKYSPGDRQFTLNVGETWKIEPPKNLWSRRSLTIQSISTNPGLEVYEVLPVLDGPGVEAACPPLQGPSLMLREPEWSIRLDYQQYQYDYFHLNAGSIITVDATIQDATKGAANIYILKGYDALSSVMSAGGAANNGFQSFRGSSIFKQFLGNGFGQTEPHTRVQYTVDSSDFYAVVYDNASSGRTNLHVIVTVQLSTHYLDSQLPICGISDTINGCSFALFNNADRERIISACILVKAVSHKEKRQEVQQKGAQALLPGSSAAGGGSGNGESVSLELDDTQVVLVLVKARIGSELLILLVSLPLLALIVMLSLEKNFLAGVMCIVCCGRRGNTRKISTSLVGSGGIMQEEKIPLKGPLPPSMAYGAN